jgi:hypothetical protein
LLSLFLRMVRFLKLEKRNSDEVKGFGGSFVVVPLVLTILSIIIILIVKLLVVDDWDWGGAILSFLGCLFVFWALSVIIFLATRNPNKVVGEKVFNSDDDCCNMLREKIVRETGRVVKDYSETGDSSAGSGYFGEGVGELVYHHIFRLVGGGHNRYALAAMNMERGRENVSRVVQSPLNFYELQKQIDVVCNSLVSKPVRPNISHTKESIDAFGEKHKDKFEEKYNVEEPEDDD